VNPPKRSEEKRKRNEKKEEEEKINNLRRNKSTNKLTINKYINKKDCWTFLKKRGSSKIYKEKKEPEFHSGTNTFSYFNNSSSLGGANLLEKLRDKETGRRDSVDDRFTFEDEDDDEFVVDVDETT